MSNTPFTVMEGDFAVARFSIKEDAVTFITEHGHEFMYVVVDAPEWEYGVTTKWGMHEHPHLAGAERYGLEIRREIAEGRASGDLAYHGHIKKRTKAKAGPWVPVE